MLLAVTTQATTPARRSPCHLLTSPQRMSRHGAALGKNAPGVPLFHSQVLEQVDAAGRSKKLVESARPPSFEQILQLPERFSRDRCPCLGPVHICPHQGQKQTRPCVKAIYKVAVFGVLQQIVERHCQCGSRGQGQEGFARPLLHKSDIRSSVSDAGYYEDDDVSLEELVRRERIEGVQVRFLVSSASLPASPSPVGLRCQLRETHLEKGRPLQDAGGG